MSRYITLSKSSFLKALQCPKALYFQKYRPELVPEVSEQQQAVFDQGTGVGVLAQQLFPGGVDAGIHVPQNFRASLDLTRDLIEKGEKIIYEAGFAIDRMHCFVDILVKEEGGWHAYEVKSSTGVKEVHVWDAAFQYFVMRLAGLAVTGYDVIVIDTSYERVGDLDIRQLFKMEPVIDKIIAKQEEVGRLVAEYFQMLDGGAEPEMDIGPHCGEPYSCEFMGHCWSHVPEYSVFDISNNRGKAWELYKMGVLEFKDIPAEFPLNDKQWQQVTAELTGKKTIDKDAIEAFLDQLEYPLHFLDFETFQSAVPMFDHSRPYQQIPFQYSLHVLREKGGEVEHREFLAEVEGRSQAQNPRFQSNSKPAHGSGQIRLLFPDDPDQNPVAFEPQPVTPDVDPRTGFIRNLISDIGPAGHIIVFNQGFESMILGQLARDFPGYAHGLEAIRSRLADLMVLFRERRYYVPAMRGSYSIKRVLPALVPGFGYDGMDIADGGMASLAFRNLYYETDPEVTEKTRRDLLAYCKLDTLAMVEILAALEKL